MTIMGSFYSSISGLTSNSTAMEVIGNNIANINTTAFKGSRTEFSDVLSRNMSLGYEIGRGSTVNGVTTVFAQGSFSTTSNVTDLALENNGFFIVRDVNGTQYTRAGNFSLDDGGYMVNSSGKFVLGYGLDNQGDATGTPTDIHIPSTPLAPRQTGDGTEEGSGVLMNVNLNSDDEVNPGGPAFDLSDPEGTSNFSTSITAYDSLGNDHLLTVYFRKASEDSTAGNTWEYHVVVDEADSATGSEYVAQSGEISFNSNGQLVSETMTSTPNGFNFSGGAIQGQHIAFDFGDSISEGGTGADGTTQYAQENSVLAATQDGFESSFISGITIDEDGKIYGRYSNGQTQAIAQIAVANFRNEGGLSQLGNNSYGETYLSGDPLVGVANESGNGRVFSSTLELSNVDIAEEFVNMITTQRGFQANSRSITTADELLQELVNLKR